MWASQVSPPRGNQERRPRDSDGDDQGTLLSPEGSGPRAAGATRVHVLSGLRSKRAQCCGHVFLMIVTFSLPWATLLDHST